MGFPGNSAGKESICNAGDPGLILGSGTSAVEGVGYPFQYSWASLVALLVKNPAMQETWIQSLVWEDPFSLGEGKGYPLQYSGLENPLEEPGRLQVHGVVKSWTQISDFTFFLSLAANKFVAPNLTC